MQGLRKHSLLVINNPTLQDRGLNLNKAKQRLSLKIPLNSEIIEPKSPINRQISPILRKLGIQAKQMIMKGEYSQPKIIKLFEEIFAELGLIYPEFCELFDKMKELALDIKISNKIHRSSEEISTLDNSPILNKISSTKNIKYSKIQASSPKISEKDLILHKINKASITENNQITQKKKVNRKQLLKSVTPTVIYENELGGFGDVYKNVMDKVI